MSDLIVGVDDVISIDNSTLATINGNTWPYITTHTYVSEMIIWCANKYIKYGGDYYILTYRLAGRNQNSHRWYFKDSDIAVLFGLRWAG